MADEFRKIDAEINPQVENKVALENAIQKENLTVPEMVTAKENASDFDKKPVKKTAGKAQNIGMLSAGLVGAVGIVLAGMTSLVNVKMKAKFDEVLYEDGKIRYSINVSDMTEKETLTIYPKRDNKILDPISLVDEDGDGVIEGTIELDKEYIQNKLDSGDNVNIKYVFDLKGVVGLNVERSFDSYVVRIDKMTSKFEDVVGECKCSVDGCFHFTMNFEDDNEIFTDFKAWIEDDFGNTSECVFTSNLHEEQKINVMNLKGSHAKLYISYKSDGVQKFVGTDGNDWIEISI